MAARRLAPAPRAPQLAGPRMRRVFDERKNYSFAPAAVAGHNCVFSATP